MKALLDAFERVVASGRPELALVAGYAGIGKSSVVKELQKAVVLPRGVFIAGKFDQQKRDIPYSTLGQMFRTLVHQILGKSEEELKHWRDMIREAIEPNGQLIINLVIQFLTALAEEGLVEFDAQAAAWRWDLAQIRTRKFTDDVVDLMITKVRRLPVATQEALKRLACLGDNVGIATLAIVNGGSEEDIRSTMWEAVRAGLVLKVTGSYKFLHDRVQEAAYSFAANDRSGLPSNSRRPLDG
jgi:predicted ATPase